jgi:two-component system, LuxR family, sensor kinase FixL
LVLGGPQYGIALFAGVIIAEIAVLRSTLEWPVIVAIGAIIASGYAGVATVIRTKFRLDVGLAHLRDVIILLLAAFVGPTVVTLLLAAVLLTGGTLGFGEISLGRSGLRRGRRPRYRRHDPAGVAVRAAMAPTDAPSGAPHS